MNLSKQKKVLLKASKEAGKILLKYFDKNPSSKEKKNLSLVSVADLESNTAIIKEIKKSFPDHNILSEESPFEDNNSDFTWIIDPVDGTHNFIRGIPIFGISIALKYKKGIVLGLIYLPVQKIMLFSQKGKGAFVNGKRLNVSNKKDLTHSFILFEFSFTERRKKLAALEKMVDLRLDLRNLGCAVYHLYLIATGRSDAYVIYHSHEWDVAAGFLAVEEAGGKITDIQGNKAASDAGNYVFSNGKIHSKIIALLK